jgi:hypothetical protein
MNLDMEGFVQDIQSGQVTIMVDEGHPLLKLARSLPWEKLLQIVLPDLKHTERLAWWADRPLRIRTHLGAYLLQQMFDLTDRQAQYSMHDNATFRVLCGYGF